MGNRTKQKEWRTFEILVARLESLLHPNGLIVRSPDHLLDHDTGTMREVDCTLHDPTTGNVITLECRKRKKKQDLLWIEQLVTKRGALHVVGTIAVSSVGFSKNAAAKAEKHDILLKTFTEAIADEVLSEFRRDLEILHQAQSANMVDLQVGIDDDGWDPPANLMDDFQARVERDGGAAALLLDTRSGSLLSVQQLLEYGLRHVGPLPAGIHRKNFELKLDPKTYALAHRDPVAYVQSVIVTMDVSVSVRTVPNVRLHQYAAKDGVQLELATATMNTQRNGPVKLQIAFKRGNGGDVSG
ncbi:MAG TPA: hypothetical protein VHB79_27585 [Polyangiaceae bacterium]|nr:hypothetical protein [Polyangiaceae bacterium]